MERELPPLLRWLDERGADLLHYKICSTFDSAPGVGSIGRAIEIALGVRPARIVPLLTAAPAMRRYQVFGHLFAGAAEGVFRLDRHPVMAHHPVTPMTESDLLRHLAAQTKLPGALLDLEALAGDTQARLDAAVAQGARILSVDCADAASEAAAGRVLWENREGTWASSSEARASNTRLSGTGARRDSCRRHPPRARPGPWTASPPCRARSRR
jgi:3-oxoisoapionate kinase